jgi:hypothetical protein
MYIPPSAKIGGRYVRGIGKALAAYTSTMVFASPILYRAPVRGVKLIGATVLLLTPTVIIDKMICIAVK